MPLADTTDLADVCHLTQPLRRKRDVRVLLERAAGEVGAHVAQDHVAPLDEEDLTTGAREEQIDGRPIGIGECRILLA